jgi:DNA replication and repair protein RecF
VRIARLELTDFRCYEGAYLELPAGITVVTGGNGAGKTSLLEAIGWAALGRSFRGVPDAVLVRTGVDAAILRVAIEGADARTSLVEAELRAVGRNRVLLDRHPLARTRDLAGAVRVSVFAPDDLVLVKGSPSSRREYLDDLLVATSPRYAATRSEYDRVLRHRNALLKGGVRDEEARATLEVFDDQLVVAGGELVVGRLRLVDRLGTLLDQAYRALATDDDSVGAAYVAEWAEGAVPDADAVPELLRGALADRRRQELERRLTLVGPHRDDWRLEIGGLGSRTHASQGEQRTLALAMRLAGHRLVTSVIGEPPVLLLDDVFSELDPARADALVAELPPGQTVVTSAGEIPASVHSERRLLVDDGRVVTG